MARATRTATVVTRASVVENLSAMDNTNGEKLAMDGSIQWLRVTAPAGGGTLAIKRPTTVDGDAVSDKSIVFGANEKRVISLVPESLYRQSDNYCYIDIPASGWTCEAYKVIGT